VTSAPNTWQKLTSPGIAAVRNNLRPFLIIQVCLVAAAVAYYRVPSVQAFAENLAQTKVQSGLMGAAIANIIASIVIPQAARALSRAPLLARRDVPFQILFFGFLGMVIDLLYQVLDRIFGKEPNLVTLVQKVCTDMFISSPLVTIPFSAAMFAFHERGYSLARTRTAFRNGGFLAIYMPMLVTCWAFWLPAVSAIYAMPNPALQFLLYLFAEAGWSLIIVHMAQSEAATT